MRLSVLYFFEVSCADSVLILYEGLCNFNIFIYLLCKKIFYSKYLLFIYLHIFLDIYIFFCINPFLEKLIECSNFGTFSRMSPNDTCRHLIRHNSKHNAVSYVPAVSWVYFPLVKPNVPGNTAFYYYTPEHRTV